MSKPPNTQRRSEKSRRATLDAALELCKQTGYRQVTIEAIASRAGVSKATIYRWWPSKGAVVLDAINETALLSATHADTGDIAADLHAQMSAVIDLFSNQRTGTAIIGLFAEAQTDAELGQLLHEQLIAPRIADFERRMQRAQEQGQVPKAADLKIALDLLYGPIYHRLAVHLDLPDKKYVEQVVAHALYALTLPERTTKPTRARKPRRRTSL